MDGTTIDTPLTGAQVHVGGYVYTCVLLIICDLTDLYYILIAQIVCSLVFVMDLGLMFVWTVAWLDGPSSEFDLFLNQI